MHDTARLISMRGFTVAVARSDDATAHVQIASLAVGTDGEGEDRRVVITTRHADGTMLTVYLTSAGIDRLAHLLADVVENASPAATTVTIQ